MLEGHDECPPCTCPMKPAHCKHEHNAWGALTDDQRAVLDFERREWTYAGAKEQAIRERFDCSAARHYQRVNALLDHPGALAYAPQLVRRLQRLREARVRQRTLPRHAGA